VCQPRLGEGGIAEFLSLTGANSGHSASTLQKTDQAYRIRMVQFDSPLHHKHQ